MANSPLIFTKAFLAALGIASTTKLYASLLGKQLTNQSIGTSGPPIPGVTITNPAAVPTSTKSWLDAIGSYRSTNPALYKALTSYYSLPLTHTGAIDAASKDFSTYTSGIWGTISSNGYDMGAWTPGTSTQGGTGANKVNRYPNGGNIMVTNNYNVAATPYPTSAQQATSNQDIGAYETIDQRLQQYNMEDLAPVIYNAVFKGNITNTKELWSIVQKSKEYAATFPGLAAHNKVAARPMTEAEYAALTQQYADTADKYGIPPGFMTKVEMGKLVAGQVSAGEFDSRIQNGYLAAKNADAATKQILQQQYGIGGGHLLAYFLNPKMGQALMEQHVAQATLQGYAKESGVPNFTGKQALQLLDALKSSTLQATGLGDPYSLNNVGAAKRGIDVAAAGQSLINNAPGSGAPHIDTNTLIGSVIPGFGGKTQIQDENAVTTAKQAAIAPFAGGGGYGQSNKGVDIGSAKQ